MFPLASRHVNDPYAQKHAAAGTLPRPTPPHIDLWKPTSQRGLRLAPAGACRKPTARPATPSLCRNRHRHTARKFLPRPDGIVAADHVDPRRTRPASGERIGNRPSHARQHHQNQRAAGTGHAGGWQQSGDYRRVQPLDPARLAWTFTNSSRINPRHIHTARLKPRRPSAIAGA